VVAVVVGGLTVVAGDFASGDGWEGRVLGDEPTRSHPFTRLVGIHENRSHAEVGGRVGRERELPREGQRRPCGGSVLVVQG